MIKTYIVGISALLAIIILGIIYWQSQEKKITILPIEEITIEEKQLEQDITELAALEQDASLDTFDKDLAEIIEEEVGEARPTPGVVKKVDITPAVTP